MFRPTKSLTFVVDPQAKLIGDEALKRGERLQMTRVAINSPAPVAIIDRQTERCRTESRGIFVGRSLRLAPHNRTQATVAAPSEKGEGILQNLLPVFMPLLSRSSSGV